ncbi:MAG: hypothetical protein J6I64_00335 [Lachnospiraceae bacterium]|nr:hypothetical protein [Lachnospiraceae bacterium]
MTERICQPKIEKILKTFFAMQIDELTENYMGVVKLLFSGIQFFGLYGEKYIEGMILNKEIS